MVPRPVLRKPADMQSDDPATLIWSREKVIEQALALLDVDPLKAELLWQADSLLCEAELYALFRRTGRQILDARFARMLYCRAEGYRIRAAWMPPGRKRQRAEKEAAEQARLVRDFRRANPNVKKALLAVLLIPRSVRVADRACLMRALAGIEPDLDKRAELDRRASIMETLAHLALKRETDRTGSDASLH